MQHPFEALRSEYNQYLAAMTVTRPSAVREAVNRILGRLNDYEALAQETGVPAAFLGALDYREDDCNPNAGLGQGDPWRRVSVNVPRGCGPFPSWLAAGKFYVNYDHLNRPPAPYAMDVALFEGEAWNGWGYRAHGTRSPYIVGATNLQQRGKYTSDGHYDAGAMDTQVGILPIIVELVRTRPALAFGAITVTAPIDPPAETPTPLPTEFKAGTHDSTIWVQHSLNVLHAVPADIAPLDEDGSYGRLTRAAVRAFQAAHSLETDGIAGPLTAAAIEAALPH